MSFFVIKGTYHIKGYSPDGDSIRFQAKNKANWAKLSGQAVALNARGHAQLRLEAIDSLETHYENQHQPLSLALKAMDFLLAGLGITGMETDALRAVVTAAQDGTDGYILTRATDKYQRPVAFVYAGEPPEQDGASLHLDPARLRHSINFQSLQAGLSYPTYYKGLFYDLRVACTTAVAKARAKRLGIWELDRTNTGFLFKGLASITDQNVILPKLFRRLVEFTEGGGGSLQGFVKWLEARCEGVCILPQGHFTHLDTLVEISKKQVRLLERPENLIFMD